MKNEKKKESLVKALSIDSRSTWYDIRKEIVFLERQEAFGCSSGKCLVSGAVAILCDDFGVKTSESWEVSEKQSLENLLEEIEKRANDRTPHLYSMGVNSQKCWSQGQWVDFRNKISEILEIYGEEENSVDLDACKREKIFLILTETPANRNHCYYD